MPSRWRAAWTACRIGRLSPRAASLAPGGTSKAVAYADYMIGFADFAHSAGSRQHVGRSRPVERDAQPGPLLGPLQSGSDPVCAALGRLARCAAVYPDPGAVPVGARIAGLRDRSPLGRGAVDGRNLVVLLPGTAGDWAVESELHLWLASLERGAGAVLRGRRVLLGGSRLWAAAAVLVACGCQEDVFVTLAWFAAVMGAAAWLEERRRGEGRAGQSPAARLPQCLPPFLWWAVAGLLALGFLLVFKYAGFAGFQTGRFRALGDSAAEILLSPILRPAVFWGNVFRPRCAYFVLALTIPLGLANVARGWLFVLGAALPLGVLLAWDFIPATSIAFQYHTLIVPLLMLGAIGAGRALLRERADPVRRGRLWQASRRRRRPGVLTDRGC